MCSPGPVFVSTMLAWVLGLSTPVKHRIHTRRRVWKSTALELPSGITTQMSSDCTGCRHADLSGGYGPRTTRGGSYS